MEELSAIGSWGPLLAVGIGLSTLLVIVRATAIRGDSRQAALSHLRRRNALLTPHEAKCFAALRAAVPDNLVFAKVRAADVVAPADALAPVVRRQVRQGIVDVYLDFLICHAQTFRPLVVVELGDDYRDGMNWREREHLLECLCLFTGLPYMRVSAREAYSSADLRGRIRESLRAEGHDTPDPAAAAHFASELSRLRDARRERTAAPPRCPQCAGPMRFLRLRRRTSAAATYWRCCRHPDCRGVLPSASRE